MLKLECFYIGLDCSRIVLDHFYIEFDYTPALGSNPFTLDLIAHLLDSIALALNSITLTLDSITLHWIRSLYIGLDHFTSDSSNSRDVKPNSKD